MSKHLTEIYIRTGGDPTDTHVYDENGARITRVQDLHLRLSVWDEWMSGYLVRVQENEDGTVKVLEEGSPAMETVHFDRAMIE